MEVILTSVFSAIIIIYLCPLSMMQGITMIAYKRNEISSSEIQLFFQLLQLFNRL